MKKAVLLLTLVLSSLVGGCGSDGDSFDVTGAGMFDVARPTLTFFTVTGSGEVADTVCNLDVSLIELDIDLLSPLGPTGMLEFSGSDGLGVVTGTMTFDGTTRAHVIAELDGVPMPAFDIDLDSFQPVFLTGATPEQIAAAACVGVSLSYLDVTFAEVMDFLSAIGGTLPPGTTYNPPNFALATVIGTIEGAISSTDNIVDGLGAGESLIATWSINPGNP